MPLREAVAFLKGAIQRSMPGGAPSRYVFHEGCCYAQNAALLASYPVPHLQGTFGLSADDLEGALARMATEPVISSGDATLILKAGRLKSSIRLFEIEPPETSSILPNAEWESTPTGLFPALQASAPFVPKEGTWQKTVKLDNGRVLALNNRSAIEITVDGLIALDPTVLTNDCVDYLIELDPAPEHRMTANAIIFFWPDTGAWVRCQLSALPWPDIIDKVLETAGTEAPIQLTQDWRDAFADVDALGEGYVTLSSGGLLGVTEHAQHNAEFQTGVERETSWSFEVLRQVFGVAERWNPDGEGPALFTGPGIRGVAMGQRR